MFPSLATAFCLLGLPGATTAFAGSRSDGLRRHPRRRRGVTSFLEANGGADTDGGSNSNSQSIRSHPWRVVIDIGREPLANMPFGWARQGVRMPLVVPTDFGCDFTTTTTTTPPRQRRRFVAPRSETVGFTGPEGARESPIVGNSWTVSGDGEDTVFEASYTIVGELRKRDVFVEAGTELVLSTRCYTQAELDRLNGEYYEAREAMWSTGGELNESGNRQRAPKKWNPQTERWEKRYPDENPFETVRNTVRYWMQNAKQERAKSRRPEPGTLSDRGGRLPGVGGSDDDDDDEFVYLVQGGAVRYGGDDGPVCGVWTAQPITNLPAWDRGR